MNKYTHYLRLRWPTLATIALCALLPGCPFTDDYFIGGSSAGAGQLLGTGGVFEYNAGGALTAAGRLDAGGGGSESLCSCESGGQEHGAGSGSHGGSAHNDAGSSSSDDAGTSGDAGSANTSTGGTGGSGGSAATAGTASGGAAGTAGGPSNLPQPACADGVIKGSVCTAASPQLCYKSCGPDNVGFKSETCQGGSYTEADCTFPAGQNYSCYQVPPSLPMECPTVVPRGGRPCDVASCTVCFGGSTFAPQYQDSTGATKQGYCVCSEIGSWTCGSTMTGSWPCPGPGCN